VKLRRVLPLVIAFVLVPAALTLTIGILILVYGSVARDYLFGGLILALVAITVAGTSATIAVLAREARVAKMQTEFMNKVSHDLRTPLTSIRMFVETLQLGRIQEPARQAEALEIISEETARLSGIINRLLDWARMESGRRSYQLRRETVDAVVDAALAAFAPQLLGGNVQLKRSVAPGLPPVLADREALSEALLNLLNNAYKYTGPEKRIEVRATRNGPSVFLSVVDDGPGIPPREQKRVFDKFYRAPDPLSRNIEGTGLGLAIVKHIVSAHGGKVSVQSEPGTGTTFTIALPAAEAS
jgi:two-component system, OmpR family, phosphate regulon sensor histidine kinase PhoR